MARSIAGVYAGSSEAYLYCIFFKNKTIKNKIKMLCRGLSRFLLRSELALLVTTTCHLRYRKVFFFEHMYQGVFLFLSRYDNIVMVKDFNLFLNYSIIDYHSSFN